jgi:hypothetical protein
MNTRLFSRALPASRERAVVTEPKRVSTVAANSSRAPRAANFPRSLQPVAKIEAASGSTP